MLRNNEQLCNLIGPYYFLGIGLKKFELVYQTISHQGGTCRLSKDYNFTNILRVQLSGPQEVCHE